MADRDSYKAGVPCWVDYSAKDRHAAADFYERLFGWEALWEPDPAAGGYGQFTMRGRRVAGIGPQFNDAMPAMWNSYVATDDVEATAEKVRNAGGQVVMPPMEVFDAGKMAGFLDAEGAFFLVWQALKHPGSQIVSEDGAYCWNELNTRDEQKALAFYPQVFGWEPRTDPGYTEWQLGGESQAGMMPMPEGVPAEVPPYWLVYFAVTDVDASAVRAIALGAEQVSPFVDSPAGRLAVLRDPQGATFALITLVPHRAEG
ncbi:VOC family protein [Actinocorallia longicatena]|uniref:VOC family protein n=1 Tax=Actinocorallia longicatena TaxID=111803 RepID=A0ABP6Q0K7_9ACTN